MACNECRNNGFDANTGWDEILDYTIAYTGLDMQVGDTEIVQGENIREVIVKIATELEKLIQAQKPFPPLPVVVLDESVTFTTTGDYLNGAHGNLIIGSVVHNGADWKFTKMTATKWNGEAMNLT